MKKIRTLLPAEIEVRPADKTKSGKVHMLLYITSRSCTNLLDETYGMENYNIEYVDVAGQIYCKLSIWDEEHNRYVVRMDTGEEAKISADKSLASDALKRTIVRAGVVELYSGAPIYIDDDGYGNTGYKVSEINYDDNRNIIHLVIANRFGKSIYSWDAGQTISTTSTTPTNAASLAKEDMIDNLTQFCTIKKAQMVDTQTLLKFYNYYKDKLDNNTFKGNMTPTMVSTLWGKWNSTERFKTKINN